MLEEQKDCTPAQGRKEVTRGEMRGKMVVLRRSEEVVKGKVSGPKRVETEVGRVEESQMEAGYKQTGLRERDDAGKPPRLSPV